MRIAIITAFPRDPSRPAGGVESVSVNLVAALTRQTGLELHVVTTDSECNEVETARWQGTYLHRLPQGHGKLLPYAVGRGRRQMQRYLLRLQPDVVHAHDTYGLMVKGLALPRVFTIHGFIHEDTRYGRGRLAWLRAHLWRRFEVAGWIDQPHLICISPFVRDRLHGVYRGVIHDIDNPIDEAFFRVTRNDDDGRIFCAAAISRLKNTLGLVDAFADVVRTVPTARLRLAGTGDDPDYLSEVRGRINERGLTDHVSLLGPVSTSQVREELARASLFVLVSLQENAPLAISEAMAVGVPVVASNRCGMPYMVREGETGFLVDPCRADGIARSMQLILSDQGLRKRMGEQARTVALDRFHPDRVSKRTYEVYRDALSSFQSAQKTR